MGKHLKVTFTDEDRAALKSERYEHPHPRVQERMEVLWCLSLGQSRAEAAVIAGVSPSTVKRHLELFRTGGLEALRTLRWSGGKPSALASHRDSLERDFQTNPPHTVAEARERIRRATGLDRATTAVRRFLKRRSV